MMRIKRSALQKVKLVASSRMICKVPRIAMLWNFKSESMDIILMDPSLLSRYGKLIRSVKVLQRFFILIINSLLQFMLV